MAKSKNKKNSYNFGSFVKKNASGIGSAGTAASGMLDTFKNPNKANVGLGAAQGVLSGASAGAALGPLGMAGGALIGGAFGLAGGIKQKQQIDNQRDATYGDLRGEQFSNMNTTNVNPYGTQMYQDGGKVAKNIKKQPNLLLPNWDGIVEKANGSIGMWGNPLDSTRVNPILPNMLLPLGNTDHRGVRTGQKYQGTPETNKAIEAKERMLKAQSSRNYYADGSDVEQNIINIEKGELQIDTKSGKILREYKGINPESAGLYQPHSKKGKDTDNNFVTAEPETFIVTKSKAGKYKKAIDNNDKLAQQSILQNIRNYKSSIEGGKLKFADGADVPNVNPYLPNTYLATSGIQPTSTFGLKGLPNFQQPFKPTILPNMKVTDMLYKPSGTSYIPKTSMLDKGLDTVSKYGPAAFNLARGMFGKVEQERYGTKITNPYLNQIRANIPQNIDMQPIYNDIYSQGRLATQDLRNNTNTSSVYRANRQNIGANTQRQISAARLQGQMANNQLAGQRAGIYANLGAQDMQEQQRLQQYNLGINQINAQNRAAKQNLLGTGISQIQQVRQNDDYNKKMYDMQMLQYNLLPQIYANWKYYAPEYDNLLKNK